ncbi:hypothetical protein J7M28_07170, partial [bacterium]|nr:hypothetical protein [bacterium]
NGIPVNEIRDISTAPNGDIWFATPAGLLCLESGMAQPEPSITISTDAETYHAGDTMLVALTYENPGPDLEIDIQIACVLPDGSLYYHEGGDMPEPYISGLLPSGTFIPGFPVLIHDFTADFPTGDYTWLAAFFEMGTMNMIGELSSASWRFE